MKIKASLKKKNTNHLNSCVRFLITTNQHLVANKLDVLINFPDVLFYYYYVFFVCLFFIAILSHVFNSFAKMFVKITSLNLKYIITCVKFIHLRWTYNIVWRSSTFILTFCWIKKCINVFFSFKHHFVLFFFKDPEFLWFFCCCYFKHPNQHIIFLPFCWS